MYTNKVARYEQHEQDDARKFPKHFDKKLAPIRQQSTDIQKSTGDECVWRCVSTEFEYDSMGTNNSTVTGTRWNVQRKRSIKTSNSIRSNGPLCSDVKRYFDNPS